MNDVKDDVAEALSEGIAAKKAGQLRGITAKEEIDRRLLRKKIAHGTPAGVAKYIESGGTAARVRRAVAAAVEEAKHSARLACLADLVEMWDNLPHDAPAFARLYLEGEILALRRPLDIKPTADEVRTQTRERVRRHRERKR